MPKKILLIDGDPLARSLAAALAPAGFSVRVAAGAQEGIDAAHAERPDAIVLAVELPGTSGYVVCNRMKKDDALRAVPLLLTSSAATPETFEQHRKLRTRAEDYLLKPFAPEVLEQRLRALVGAETAVEPPRDAAGDDAAGVDSTLAALDAAASAPAADDDGELRAFDEAFEAIASAAPDAEPLAAPSFPPREAGRDDLEERLAHAERALEQARLRIEELEAEVATHEARVVKAYRQLKGDEEARAKARKALAIALQLLGATAPAAAPEPPRDAGS